MMCERRREIEGKKGQERRGAKGSEIDYREVAPPGQDSCQPGPDMTSAEGEAGRAQPVVGGVRGWHQGAVQRGAFSIAVHARLWLLSTLTSWQLSLSLSSCDTPLYLSFTKLSNLSKRIICGTILGKNVAIQSLLLGMEMYLFSRIVQESFLNPYPIRICTQTLKT